MSAFPGSIDGLSKLRRTACLARLRLSSVQLGNGHGRHEGPGPAAAHGQ